MNAMPGCGIQGVDVFGGAEESGTCNRPGGETNADFERHYGSQDHRMREIRIGIEQGLERERQFVLKMS